MVRHLLLFAAVSLTLEAKEVSSEKLHFSITFPEGAGWAPVDHQSQGDELQVWSTESQSNALVLCLQIIDAPMPEAKPTFQENAEEWEKGVMTRFSRKISSRFSKLAGRDAFQLIATLKNGEEELFFSNWMVQVGDVTYGLTIISIDQTRLSGDVALAYLKSFELAK